MRFASPTIPSMDCLPPCLGYNSFVGKMFFRFWYCFLFWLGLDPRAFETRRDIGELRRGHDRDLAVDQEVGHAGDRDPLLQRAEVQRGAPAQRAEHLDVRTVPAEAEQLRDPAARRHAGADGRIIGKVGIPPGRHAGLLHT